jgi:3-deoxy-D-manno-octulosonic-acid transferase
MYLIYSVLLTLGLLVLLPRFLIDAVRHGKYVTGIRQRLGRLPTLNVSQLFPVWLHCVSVGEAHAARPLVKAIREKFPNQPLVISTTTLTGQNLAQEIFKDQAAAVFYFPFDWRWTTRRALRRIQPAAVLLMETEIWPNFLKECELREIPVAIVNGRLSENSFRCYRIIKAFIGRVLSILELGLMQTEADARRIRTLGMDPNKVFVSGNLKFDAGVMPIPGNVSNLLKSRFSLSSETSLILAASTHAPEEQIILKAFQQVRHEVTSLRLMLAPRHPERFEEAASLLRDSGLPWARRSIEPNDSDKTSAVILLDTIGELPSVYALASIVFVGGSIARNGGHNILEPAAFGSCIITGFHTYNFAEIVKTFVEAGAVIQLQELSEAQAVAELKRLLSELLADGKRREQMGQLAKSLMEKNIGATERTLQMLCPMLDRRRPGATVTQISVESAPLA